MSTRPYTQTPFQHRSSLTFLEIREALRHRLILFTKLFGLSLDILKLVGVPCSRESKKSRRGY
jgi:hypothetical protein